MVEVAGVAPASRMSSCSSGLHQSPKSLFERNALIFSFAQVENTKTNRSFFASPQESFEHLEVVPHRAHALTVWFRECPKHLPLFRTFTHRFYQQNVVFDFHPVLLPPLSSLFATAVKSFLDHLISNDMAKNPFVDFSR